METRRSWSADGDADGRTDEAEAEPLRRAFLRLHDYLTRVGYRGWEWGDILESPWVSTWTRGRPLAQRVAIQIGRRSIVGLRGPLRVPKRESPNAYGFCSRAYLHYHRATGEERWLRIAESQLEWLRRNPSPGFEGLSWGHAFDYVSRGGWFPAGLPTVVWTSHISRAFWLAHALTGDERHRDAVEQAAHFIARHLVEQRDETGICLSYAPGRPNPVHNANLLGAVALLRAWRFHGNQEYFELAREALEWSCGRVRADGGWPYGDGPEYGWIDNFHTAYNLDCLIEARALTGGELVPEELIERTYDFWVGHFFLEDGTPRYYADRTAPRDIQCAAQAIETLAGYADRDPRALDRAGRVAAWTLTHMQKPNGSFRYRRGPGWSNGLECLHWGQATTLCALGRLLEARRVAASESSSR